MKVVHSLVRQFLAEFSSHIRRDELTRHSIVVGPLIHLMKPVWQGHLAKIRNTLHALEVRLQHDSGHNRHRHAPRSCAIKKFEVDFWLKEKLGDCTVSTSVLLRSQECNILVPSADVVLDSRKR